MPHVKAFRKKAMSLGLSGVLGAIALPALAQVPKEPIRTLDMLEFFRPELAISTSNVRLEQVVNELPNRTAWQTFLQERAAVSAAPLEVVIDPPAAAAGNHL
jgi:hypothetical protein